MRLTNTFLVYISRDTYILCEVNTSFSNIVKERILAYLETYSRQRIKRGVERGKTQSPKESKLEIAKAMLKKNMDINLIAEITNLYLDDLEKIKS